jgi:hypothetical protein
MPASEVQTLLLCAAFWVAVAGYRGCATLRFLSGLVLGAVCAHLGWALLRADVVAAHPLLLLDLRAGYCVLFVPLGMLAVAPWREGRGSATRFLCDTLSSLPLALAVARLGCLVLGCCAGAGMGRDSLFLHPVALYDIAGLTLLHFVLLRSPRDFAAPVFCVGFGELRLLLEPLRGASSPAESLLPVSLAAGLWIALGLLLSRPAPSSSSPAVSSSPLKMNYRSPTPRLPHMGAP